MAVDASAYYHRASGKRSPRRLEDERLLERIRELHAANYYARDPGTPPRLVA